MFSAVYTAFLLAQAKGRDFWQNPLLSVHLLAHALLAGAAVWLIAALLGGREPATARQVFVATLIFSVVTLIAELWNPDYLGLGFAANGEPFVGVALSELANSDGTS